MIHCNFCGKGRTEYYHYKHLEKCKIKWKKLKEEKLLQTRKNPIVNEIDTCIGLTSDDTIQLDPIEFKNTTKNPSDTLSLNEEIQNDTFPISTSELKKLLKIDLINYERITSELTSKLKKELNEILKSIFNNIKLKFPDFEGGQVFNEIINNKRKTNEEKLTSNKRKK